MSAYLLEPFSYGYMVNAMWVSALVGGVCAFLSAYLMLKGWSLIGDALSHSIVPGVAGGLYAGSAIFHRRVLCRRACGGCNVLSQPAHQAARGCDHRPDLHLVFSALGLFMVSLSPAAVNIQTIVLGNVLAITPSDTLQLVIISGVTLLVLAFKWKDLMVAFFDENHARSIGLNPGFLRLIFFTLLSACTVAAMQTVGAFLVIAMVVTPGATGVSPDGPVPAARGHCGCDWRALKLRWCLRELFPRWGDGRDHRGAADAGVSDSLCPCTEARASGGAQAGT